MIYIEYIVNLYGGFLTPGRSMSCGVKECGEVPISGHRARRNNREKISEMTKFKTAAVLAALSLAPVTGLAADCPGGFPSNPITFTVGYGAGGGTDTTARKVASMLEQRNGWTIVVDNKPGADGAVMAIGLQNAPADGYRVGITATSTVSVSPHRDASVPYDYTDFRYLGSGMLLNFGLVALADQPYGTLDEFIAYARKNGRATVSAAALTSQIMVKDLAKFYDVPLIAVPTKGSADALKDALGGHVDATIQATLHVDQIRAGKMVQLATLTGERAIYAPEAKTVSELGLPSSMEGHIIFMVPKGTPDDVFSCLSGALEEVTSDQEYIDFMAGRSTTPSNMGPEGTARHVAERSAFYENALKTLND